MQRKAASSSAFLNPRVLIAFPLFVAACSIITGNLLGVAGSKESTNISRKPLTFAERVDHQRAIEEVYWRHRIWPRENLNPKPSLDEVMSQAQLEKKVEDYLRSSRALEDYRRKPITAEQLQAEMDRMAGDTKQPEVLRELFEALGNNPFVIAECLARPILVERGLAIAESRTPSPEGSQGKVQAKSRYVSNADYTLPTVSDAATGCTADTWTRTSTLDAPTRRVNHTAVWTGSEMIVWGGCNSFYLCNDVSNTGGKYIPSTDSWIATGTINAPDARYAHTAVWTGSEMIVWGGWNGGGTFNTGGRYNPGTDSWTATSTTNAPSARFSHTAVWTGSEMIVWSGLTTVLQDNSGGRYNPTTDTWTTTSTTDAPDGRYGHTALWTGSEMIVWGGHMCAPNCEYFNTGGRYDPIADTWTATSTGDAPDARYFHTAVWTGSEMIVWGGFSGFSGGFFNTGGRYNPHTDTWTATSTTDAPAGRYFHTAVWTGNEMIVWGGFDGNSFNTGGTYNPDTDNWIPTSTTNAADARYLHSAIWNGDEMIVWAGLGEDNDSIKTGGRYCVQSGSPTPTATASSTATATPTGTPMGSPTATPSPSVTPSPSSCSVTSDTCGTIVNLPTDFFVEASDVVDSGTLDGSDFTVNGIPADDAVLLSGGHRILFTFNASPVIPGVNTMHIPAGAFNCFETGPVAEFTCTFQGLMQSPTPTPSATSTATPTATPTPILSPRPTPFPRSRPTPAPRP